MKPLDMLGANRDVLTLDERRQLRTVGALALRDVFGPSDVATMRRVLDGALSAPCRPRQIHTASATLLLDGLATHSLFKRFVTAPRVLASVREIIGQNVVLSDLHVRSPKAGIAGNQPLHRDFKARSTRFRRSTSRSGNGCTVALVIDEFTPVTGSTRVVPCSHRLKADPSLLDNPKAPHPGEVRLALPPGTALVLHPRVWHGGTINTTRSKRRTLFALWARVGDPLIHPQTETMARIPDIETYTWAERRVLGLAI